LSPTTITPKLPANNTMKHTISTYFFFFFFKFHVIVKEVSAESVPVLTDVWAVLGAVVDLDLSDSVLLAV